MEKYKEALVRYINQLNEEVAESLYWKLLKELLDKHNTEERNVFVECLAEAINSNHEN